MAEAKPDVPSRKLKVVYRPTASLTHYAGNARYHPRRQMEKLKSSVRALGFISPLIIDEKGVVLCGNLRLAMAKAEGLPSVPTIMIEGLTEAERVTLVLADNRIANEATWDRGKLKAELEVLQSLNYEVELTGFDTLEIESILNLDSPPAQTDTDGDDVDLSEAKPVTKLGDLWRVGPHHIFCGDSRQPDSFRRLLGKLLVSTIFTDPPYNIPIENHVSGHGRVKHSNFLLGCGELPDDQFAETILLPALVCMAEHAAPGANAFVCCDWRHVSLFEAACAKAFHVVKSLVVWAKTNASNSGFLRPQFELIWVWQAKEGPLTNNVQMSRGGAGLGTKGRHRSNLWTYAGANVFRQGRLEDLADHATVKPKKLVADAIRDVTKVGEAVLDGFLGSGTTLAACAMTGRVGYGIELDPKFVDVALRRLSQIIGEPPRLVATGETFDEVAARRQAGEPEPESKTPDETDEESGS